MIDFRFMVLCLIAMTALSGCDRGAPVSEVEPVTTANAVEPVAPGPAATPTPSAPTPVAGPRSAFTSLDLARCIEIARNDEEAGYSRHRCVGAAGYRVEVIESDLRQTINLFRPGGGSDPLRLSALVAGGGFSSLGKIAEWRGTDPARPRTLTVRYGVNEDPDPEVAPRSYLVVIRLASPACVVARIVPGPQQSEQARAVADGASLPACIGR